MPPPILPADEFHLSEAVTLAAQLRTLRTLFDHVAAKAGCGLRPVVEVDLDLCGLAPVFRTMEALRICGDHFRIAEFSQPEKLPVLPGYSDEAWQSFLDATQIEAKYPHLAWRSGRRPSRALGSPFGWFHDLYWTASWLAEDAPTPGLGAFVHRIGALGGTVVFFSGRWLPGFVEGTRLSLQRAGIPDPVLVIGNPWHETLPIPRDRVLSDAQVKVRHQTEIRQHGEPVAVIDDRRTNRDAVVHALGGDLLSIAIALPGFTFDAASLQTEWRISTFETFDYVVGQPPSRPLMEERYPGLGSGRPWRGLYEGLGKNDLPYVLPRNVSADSSPPTELPGEARPYASLVAAQPPGTMREEQFLEACAQTIPAAEYARLREAFAEAGQMAQKGLAAPFPEDEQERNALWLGLVAAWLHSRDIECLMGALGFPIQAAGVHDLDESVDGTELIAFIKAKREEGAAYAPWLLQWLGTLKPGEPVNVGFLNPSLLVSVLQWSPQAVKQDGMDVHRASTHHDGDNAERYDPLEAAVNNLLHQREGRCALRKEAVVSWDKLEEAVRRETEAEQLAKNSLGRQPLRDAIRTARILEEVGAITPWGIVE